MKRLNKKEREALERERVAHEAQSKLLAASAAKIVNLVKAGNHPPIAAQSVGVSRATYFRWQRSARDGVQPFAEFFAALSQAQAESEAREVVTVQRASQVDKQPVKCPECEHEWEADFLQMLTQARLTESAQRLKTAAAQNSLQLLQVRFPKRWSPRVIHTIEEEHSRLLDIAQSVLPKEQYEALLEAYLADEDGEVEAPVEGDGSGNGDGADGALH